MNLHLVDAALPLSPPRAVLHGYRRVLRAGGDVGEWPELLGPVSVALEVRGWVGYAPTAYGSPFVIGKFAFMVTGPYLYTHAP